jgi:hypothetical protein
MPGRLVIDNVPAKTREYFATYYTYTATMDGLSRQINEASVLTNSLQVRIDKLTTYVESEKYRLAHLQAEVHDQNMSNPDAPYTFVKATYVQKVRDDEDRLERLKGEFTTAAQNLSVLNSKYDETSKQLKLFTDSSGVGSTEIRVKATGRKSFGCPVLIAGE